MAKAEKIYQWALKGTQGKGLSFGHTVVITRSCGHST